LTALKSIRVVDIDLGDGTPKRSVTAGTHRAAAVLRVSWQSSWGRGAAAGLGAPRGR